MDDVADAAVVNDSTNRTSARAAPRSETRSLSTWLEALIVGVLALLPRCLGLADFFTLDEANSWVKRVDRFSDAVAHGDWAATVITGHPGVTVMWLGALGRWTGRLVGIGDPGWGGGASYLALLRLPVTIINSLTVVLGFLLLRRLFRAETALLAALLWATSPFIIAHSRLLHLDALVTSFITLSMLLLLHALTTDHQLLTTTASASPLVVRRLSLLCSGICAGFALLTKAPSLVWLPLAGLILAFGVISNARLMAGQWRVDQALRSVRIICTSYLAWLGCAVLTVVALWPALWVAPLHTLGIVVNEIVTNGGEPHALGNYFAGQPSVDPGWLFYPVVILWRTTPITLIGLLLLVGTTAYELISTRRLPPPASRLPPHVSSICLAFFVVAFSIVLGVEPKKFDRYLLPVWPALEILAAGGWMKALDVLRRRWTTDDRRPTILHPAALGSWFLVLVTVFSIGTLIWFHPYYIAYFNPLLGGSATGQYMMQVGWGEGQEKVGAWLSGRADIKKSAVYTWDPAALGPFVSASADLRDLRDQDPYGHSGYAVLYVRNVQRQDDPKAIAYIQQTAPLYTLRQYGVQYANVHQLPFPYKQASDATFGDGLHLRGFTQQLKNDTLTITPSWDVQATQNGGKFCFVHLLNARGQVVAQADQPLDHGTYPTWQAGQQFGDPIKLAVKNLPAGMYRLSLGVYEPSNNARLPLRQGQAARNLDGPNVIDLLTLTLPS